MATAEQAENGLTRQQYYPLERRRFVVLGLLWMIEFLFWSAWFIQAPLLVPFWGIRDHVAFDQAVWLMTGVDIAAIFTSFLSGYIYDRLGPRNGVALILAIVTVGFGLRPLATHSFSWMLALSIIAGAGLPIQAAPPAVISQWFGHHRMAFPLGVVMSAFAVGQTVGLVAGFTLVSDLGAVWAFSVFSLALIFFLIAWLVLVPRAPRSPAGPPGAQLPPLRQALPRMARANGSWTFFVVGTVYAGIAVFATSFLPGVLGKTFGLTPAQAGSSVAVYPALEIPGMLVIGYAAARSARIRTHGFRTAAVQLFLWLAFILTWWAGVQPLALALVLVGAIGFFYLPCFTFGLVSMERLGSVGAETAGIAAGFYFTGVSLGGYVLPTALAAIGDAAGPGGGFIGLLALVAIGVVVWAASLSGRRRPAAVTAAATHSAPRASAP